MTAHLGAASPPAQTEHHSGVPAGSSDYPNVRTDGRHQRVGTSVDAGIGSRSA